MLVRLIAVLFGLFLLGAGFVTSLLSIAPSNEVVGARVFLGNDEQAAANHDSDQTKQGENPPWEPTRLRFRNIGLATS